MTLVTSREERAPSHTKRVRKTVGGVYREYVSFGGAVIAERTVADVWTDYIHFNGRRLARGEYAEDRIRTWGSQCSGCAASRYAFTSVGSLAGYTIQAGDKLFFPVSEYPHGCWT